MANSETIKTTIDANINTNGNQAITGAVLNYVLKLMVDSTDAQLVELSEENAQFRERIAEQDIFIEDLQNTKIDRENDDYYPKMAVGTADNLAGVDVVDSEINFRRSGGGAISNGVARIESIKGNSVVYNQFWEHGRKQGTWDNSDGTTNKYEQLGFIKGYSTATNGHKLCVIVLDKGSGIDRVYLNDQVQTQLLGGAIFEAKATQTSGTSLTARVPAGVVANYDISVSFIDLTKMFGSGNEPITIEEFYQRIPQGIDLNAYNEGEVINMKAIGIISKGVNAWNGIFADGYINTTNGQPIAYASYKMSANPIKVMPNTAYYIKATSARIFFYDQDDAFISYQSMSGGQAGVFTTPNNASFVRFFVDKAYATNDICINISNADINGKYFPYEEVSEDLSIVAKYFPNGMRSAGTAHDEIRYIKQTNRFNAMRRIKAVWLKDLDWAYAPAQGYFYSTGNIYAIEGSTIQCRLLCNAYDVSSWSNFVLNYAGAKQNMIAVYTNGATGETRLNVLDSRYTDVATFKASLEGVFAYVESSEPIVTEIEEKDFNLDYKVWNCGTEQMVATEPSSALSAGITYGFNAIGKIKEQDADIAAIKAALAKAGITIDL